MSVQALFPGRLEQAYRRELALLASSQAVRRLWSRDVSLWPEDSCPTHELSGNLAWLDLPQQIGRHMQPMSDTVLEAQRKGFQDLVFVAIGDSNLAIDAVSSTQLRWRRVFLLDGIDLAAIQAIDAQLDVARTLFVFASKSGKQIENHALLLYFLERLRMQGATDPGRCFVAITEAGSYLDAHARSYGFLATFHDPPGIAGRYSSLLHFGLLLCAVSRFDPADLELRAMGMRDLCQGSLLPESDPADANPASPNPASVNPALTLAAFLAAAADDAHATLLLLSTPSLEGLTHRLAQLVGTSMSKGGRGLIPVTGSAPRQLEPYRQGSIAAILSMSADPDGQLTDAAAWFKREGVPLVSVELESPAELGAEGFKWEIATALACSQLHVNPFDEPDTQIGRERSAAIVEGLAARGELPVRRARVVERGIELYAEGATRLEISTLNLAEGLRSFLALKKPDDYLAIISFVGANQAARLALGRVREQLASRLGMPVLLTAGPRYPHYFEQIYKGGPARGMFLILTIEAIEGIPIPGAGYTFGQLQTALAMGDLDALELRQKPAIRLHLTSGAEAGLNELEQIIPQALNHTRGSSR